MAFISEPHFSGLNWNPHPVQPRTDTFHLWAQLFGVELRHEVVQPPIDGFHLWTSLFGLNWNPHPVSTPPALTPFISEHNFSGLKLRHEVQPPTDGFHLWTSLFRGWTHAHTNQYGIWRQLASINLLSTKQTVGIQTETEPISGSFTLREPKRTQTNQRLTGIWCWDAAAGHWLRGSGIPNITSVVTAIWDHKVSNTRILVRGFNPSEKNSQIGSFPQLGVKIRNIWNHHLESDEVHEILAWGYSCSYSGIPIFRRSYKISFLPSII